MLKWLADFGSVNIIKGIRNYTLILTCLPDDRHQKIGSVYRTCIILYLVTFYTLPSGQNMLKLRYRVRGMTSQENNRHSPCHKLILTASTLLILAKIPGKVNV